MLHRVGLEMRLHHWEIESDALEMGVRAGEFDRKGALSGTDIGESLVVGPGEFVHDRVCSAKAQSRHCLKEVGEDCRAPVNLIESVAALLGLVLRLAGPQPLS